MKKKNKKFKNWPSLKGVEFAVPTHFKEISKQSNLSTLPNSVWFQSKIMLKLNIIKFKILKYFMRRHTLLVTTWNVGDKYLIQKTGGLKNKIQMKTTP